MHPGANPMLSWLKKLLGRSAAPSAGVRGEKVAAAWLQRERGFVIVARNWRSPHDRRDEIDLVARDGEALVFIEVKTRAPGALVPGIYAVDARKKSVLLRAARSYLAGLRAKPRTVRLDVVEVELPADGGAGEPQIRHFEHVALFPKHFEP